MTTDEREVSRQGYEDAARRFEEAGARIEARLMSPEEREDSRVRVESALDRSRALGREVRRLLRGR